MGFHLHPETASTPGIVEGDHERVVPQVGSEGHTTQAPQAWSPKMSMWEKAGEVPRMAESLVR
jgi:hypothetical protein